MKRVSLHHIALTTASVAAIFTPRISLGVTRNWFNGDGFWTAPGNWSPTGAPDFGDKLNLVLGSTASFGSTCTYDYSGALLKIYDTVVIDSQSVSNPMVLVQQANTFSCNTLVIGQTFNSQYLISGGVANVGSTTLDAGGFIRISGVNTVYNAGDFTQNGGAATFNGNGLNLSGTYTYLGGSTSGGFTNNGTLLFNPSSAGTFDVQLQNLGTTIVNGSGTINTITNHGTFIINADLTTGLFTNYMPVTLPAGHTITGLFSAEQGTFTQLGNVNAAGVEIANGTWDWKSGSLSAQGEIVVGEYDSASNGNGGTFIMESAATLNLQNSSQLLIGQGNTGTFIQNSGTLVSSQGIVVGSFPLENGTAPRGIYVLNAGTIELNSATLIVGGENSTSGTFTQNGGVASLHGLVINEQASSAASYNLNAGVLQANNAGNNGAFNQSGGTSSFGGFFGVGSITLSGNAVMQVGVIRQQSVSLSGSAILKIPVINLTPSRVQVLNFQTAGNTVNGRWDLNSALIIDYTGSSPIADIRKYIIAGYHGGDWQGNGLYSSITALNIHALHLTALGYAEASDVLGASGGMFENTLVDGTSVLVKYTYAGDSNLDGKVDVTDLGNLASNWQKTGNWINGDFNYDGSVNVTDLGLLASNWQAGVGNPLGPDSFQQTLMEFAVGLPEPAALFTLLPCLLARRQPRKRK